jgi:hypothetical protein
MYRTATGIAAEICWLMCMSNLLLRFVPAAAGEFAAADTRVAQT